MYICKADTVLDLKVGESKKSYGRYGNIKLIIAQPFPSQPAKWLQEARRRYDKILQKAERIIAVSDDPYSTVKIQKRNEWIIDNSDAVIAVWDGSLGWTANTVNYTERNGKPVLQIN